MAYISSHLLDSNPPCHPSRKIIVRYCHHFSTGARYAPRTQSSNDVEAILFSPVVTTGFGALHLIAWNFQLPSHIERLLWRIASLSISGIPAMPLVLEISVGALLIIGLIIFTLFIILKWLEAKCDFCFPNRSFSLPESVVIMLEFIWVVIKILATIAMYLASPVLGPIVAIPGLILVTLTLSLPAALVGCMVARLLLLFQAVALLREQPESAFHAID